MTNRRGLRWTIVGLLVLATIANYLDRMTLGVAAPTMIRDLEITTQQYSYIVAAFSLAYGLSMPVAGFLLDAVSLRRGFAWALGLWSIAGILHGFASSWQMLAGARVLLGAIESSLFPTVMKTISDWFPAKERSVALGWQQAGTSLGAMLAPPIVAWCILSHSWQFAFFFTGGLGFVVLVLWLLFYNTPAEHKLLSAEERDYIETGKEAHLKVCGPKTPLKDIFFTRRLWGFALPRALADPAWVTFGAWIPLFMTQVHHMDLKQIAIFGWLPFLSADLGCLCGGYVVPLFVNRFKVSLINARRLTVTGGALLMIGPASIGLTGNPYIAIALFCVGGFAHQVLSGALISLASDMFDKDSVGTATGFGGMAGSVGALLFTLAVGALVSTIGFGPLFALLGIFDLVGTIVVWTVLPGHVEFRARVAPVGQG